MTAQARPLDVRAAERRTEARRRERRRSRLPDFVDGRRRLPVYRSPPISAEEAAANAFAIREYDGPPRSRQECLPGEGEQGQRPCPWLRCRYHLGVDPAGAVLHVPTLARDPWEAGCALDVASEGPKTLEDVGLAMGLGRERVRQIEEKAFEKLRASDAAGRFGPPGTLREMIAQWVALRGTPGGALGEAMSEEWEEENGLDPRHRRPTYAPGREPKMFALGGSERAEREWLHDQIDKRAGVEPEIRNGRPPKTM